MLREIILVGRPAQWLKNLILFAALIFAGYLTDTERLFQNILAFVVFCFLSSALYIINDIRDKDNDQIHPIKKNRPIAAGRLSSSTAGVVVVIFIIIGLILSYRISINFLYISLVFLGFNLLYNIWLKNVVIVDVMSIGISFVIRAYAGAIAVNLPASKWMIINTLLLALFLGFGKRRHEILLLESNADSHRKSLIKYSPYLLDQLIGVVTASVVVMYMLYTFSTEVISKLGTDNLFLTIPFVVYGIFRYLYLIHGEEKGGSPTKILIGDIPILLTVLLWIITVVIVLYIL